jgi:hypothetical protein
MSHLPLLAGLISLGLCTTLAASPRERYALDLEWGTAWQQSNDVQSPNDASGTRFALDALTGAGPYSAPRLQLVWPLNARDDLRLLAAPFRISAQGTLASPVNFEGKSPCVKAPPPPAAPAQGLCRWCTCTPSGV